MKACRAGVTAATIVATGALAAGPAQASDAGLRKVVKAQEKKVAPLARAFGAADKALAAAPDTNAAAAATGAFRTGLHGFKLRLVPIKTQTARAASGKKRMLTAIREFDLGLVQYQHLLQQVAAGADKATLQTTFVSLNKRLRAAAADEAAALKILGFRTSSPG